MITPPNEGEERPGRFKGHEFRHNELRGDAGGRIVASSEAFEVVREGQFDRLRIGYVRDGRLFATEDHFVFASDDPGGGFRACGRLGAPGSGPWEVLKDKLARSRIARSVRRNVGPGNIAVLTSGTILLFYDCVYRSDDGGRTFQPVHYFGPDCHAPFSHGFAVTPSDHVYFGEYNCMPGRRPIHIYRGTNDGRIWQVCHEFGPGEVFHVHSVRYDDFRNRLWICTGDRDEQSYLLYTDDEFQSIHELGGNDQDWRICSLIVTKDSLFWGSDNDRTGAGIFRWSFSDQKREKLLAIGKPSYFSTQLRDGTLVISTTFEPESPYTRRFSPQPSADIWVSRHGLQWHRILQLPYQPRTMAWGKARATIVLAAGDNTSSQLAFTPFHTKEYDFTCQVYRIRWKA